MSPFLKSLRGREEERKRGREGGREVREREDKPSRDDRALGRAAVEARELEREREAEENDATAVKQRQRFEQREERERRG